MKTIAIFFSSFVVACGGTIVDVDGGADSGGSKDVVTIDAVLDSGGPFACGKAFCTTEEICIHPCCGGAMICAALEDAGTCPQGLTISQQCPPEQPCTNVCTPPPPYCGTTKDCSMPQGHDCYLLCQ
ncbi:MAG TPA: hypothetical protein VH054_07190 [Polyangiaceae bacterium]|jgi:hypothetical protein|nr:hypothetical protein [Polyangiaceae bacterium]